MKNYTVTIKNLKTGVCESFTELGKSAEKIKTKWRAKTLFDKQKKNGKSLPC